MKNEQQESECRSRLVVVLETNDQIQLAMARGLLEDAGIPLFIQDQFASMYPTVDAFLSKWVRLQVPEDCAAEAQELLEQLKPGPLSNLSVEVYLGGQSGQAGRRIRYYGILGEPISEAATGAVCRLLGTPTLAELAK